MNIRQVCVIRKDWAMSPGLLSAQVAHVSAQFILNRLSADAYIWRDIEKQWFSSPVVSVLSVENPEELVFVINRAKEAKLQVTVWEDTIWSENAKTFLKGVVGCAIGPDNDETLKQITGGLKLY